MVSRTLTTSVLGALLCAALVACVKPHEAGDGEAGAPPSTAGAPTQTPHAGPAPAAEPGKSGLPSLAALAEQGASVTISGKVAGATNGQVDFIIATDDKNPANFEIVHVAPISDGAFSASLPAEYEHPLYLNALSYPEGGGPTPGIPSGGIVEPITVGTTDIVVQLDIAKPDVLERVFGVEVAEAADAGAPTTEAPPAP